MTTEPQAQTSERERLDGDAAHTAICQAVALLNVSIGAAVDDNARQAHTILRSYLADPPMLRADAEENLRAGGGCGEVSVAARER